MRVGLSWDLGRARNPLDAWPAVLGEIEQADRLGYDSVWVAEGRDAPAACPSPALFMTHASRRTRNVQLGQASRSVAVSHPVRLAEEVAVLDQFSRGRAGIAFAGPGSQGASPGHVQETIDFVISAWTLDEFRYRGDHVRFPSHTADDAPRGASAPASGGEFVPQWRWGPRMPDHLAITPKPYVSRPPVYVEIDDDDTLQWAARQGVSPFVRADVPQERAVERLARYRKAADEAGRKRGEVDAVLERRISFDGPPDAHTLAGGSDDLIGAIRELRAAASISHLIWRRDGGEDGGDLSRFASEVQMLLQA